MYVFLINSWTTQILKHILDRLLQLLDVFRYYIFIYSFPWIFYYFSFSPCKIVEALIWAFIYANL
jgi:hypothetical protein